MATTVDLRAITRGEPTRYVAPIKNGSTVYLGALGCIDYATGRIVTAADDAALRDVGLITAIVDANGSDSATGDSDGTVKAELSYNFEVAMALYTGGTQDGAALGGTVYVKDNATVAVEADVSHYIAAGVLTGFVTPGDSGTTGWVMLNHPSPVTAIS